MSRIANRRVNQPMTGGVPMQSVVVRMLVPLILFTGSGCAVANRMSGASEARAIHARGHAASAVILEMWDTGVTVNDDPVVGMRVKVATLVGEPYEATIPRSRVSRVHIPQVQPGLTVRVFVDPQAPSRVALGLYDLR
jgi:hypothetical protein